MKSFPKARRDNRVTPGTDLCIEGPAGSGNSYFVRAFALANPGMRLAYHHHVASQIIRAVHLDIPTIALLRHPLDCVTSRTSRSPHMIGAMFRQWIRFFRAVDRYGDSVVIGRFESVTTEPAEFIRYVNQRCGTDFYDAMPEEETVFRAMDEAFSGGSAIRRQNPNRPSAERERLKQEIRPRVAEHELASAAVELYDKLSHQAR